MVDLHLHTTYSDGEFGVEELLNLLIDKNISLFSITDHDSVDAYYELKNIPSSISIVPGVEISSRFSGFDCHILGYNIRVSDSNLIKFCNDIQYYRKIRLQRIITYLQNTFNLSITPSEIEMILSKPGSLGKPDILKLLLKKNYGSVSQIYNTYLKKMDVGIEYRQDIEKVVSVIKNAGGVAVLAHPKEIEQDYLVSISEILPDFISCGVEGIEVYNSIHTNEDILKYKKLAEEYGLYITGGSDYHGPLVKPKIQIGNVSKDFCMIKRKDIYLK